MARPEELSERQKQGLEDRLSLRPPIPEKEAQATRDDLGQDRREEDPGSGTPRDRKRTE